MNIKRTGWRVGVVAAALACVPVAAQMRGLGAMGRRAALGAGLMAEYLGLTDAQKAEMKSVREAAAASAKPLREQLRQEREAMQTAIRSGAATDQQIQHFAQSQAKVMAELIVISAKTRAKLHAILTPEQRAKSEKLGEAVRSRLRQRQQRLGRRFPDAQ